jgi:hypothetical protein
MSRPAAHQVRRFSRGVQQPATSPSSRHEVPRVSLYSLNPSLSRPAGTGLSFPRQNHPGHVLRTYLSSPQKNQSQHGLRWSSCRYQRSRGRYLAGQLYELRSWLRRSGGKNFATCVWRIDTVTVKRSDPRNALQLRKRTPDDFILGFCRGRPDAAASTNL